MSGISKIVRNAAGGLLSWEDSSRFFIVERAAFGKPSRVFIRGSDFGAGEAWFKYSGTDLVSFGNPGKVSKEMFSDLLQEATGKLITATEQAGGVAVGDGAKYRRLRIASAVPVTLTGTTVETTLAHIKIPGGSMGPNGKITIRAAWSMNNNANTKRGRVNFGGPAGTNATYVAGLSSVAFLTIVPECVIYNRNSQNSQVASPANTVAQTGSTAPKTLTVDTTVDQYLDITGELTSSLDTITLEWYEVVVEYGA